MGTISQWYRSVDGSPGFTEEALIVLSKKQQQASLQGYQILCNLVLDEVSIRKQIEWTGKRFTGYIDIGSHLDSDVLPEAREAIVFLLVALNGHWKIPVGYFFIDGLSGNEKANLVNKCLEFVHTSGVVVTSITCDGAPANFKMMEELGANFKDASNLKTHFKHPVTNKDVYIYCDPCHMIKLVRNCFGSQKKLKDGNNQNIEWCYMEKLVEIQYEQGLHLANKLKFRHLDWEREKMKVRLAVQVFSRSVSDALIFLAEHQKHSEFKDAKPTANFIRKFNDLFDIFNTRNNFAKYQYKRPLSQKNSINTFEYLKEIEDYILQLSLNGVSVLKCNRKTGFLGFLICITSLRKMFQHYVIEKNMLKYLLTYKISQDHLELFFSAIRMRGGFNNNPTARQFETAYKRLLIHTEIKEATTGNVMNLEDLKILTYGSGITINENGEDLQQSKEYLTLLDNFQIKISTEYIHSEAWNLTPYLEDVVGYISGYVGRSVSKCITCSYCKELLHSCVTNSSLQKSKQYGKLFAASTLLIQICTSAEKFFRFFLKTEGLVSKSVGNKLLNTLVYNTIKNIDGTILNAFSDHLFDDDPLDNHVFDVIKLILKIFFKIRIHHELTKKIDIMKRGRIRSMNTKSILFRNE